jgi:predicted nucleotidyltransferase
MVSEEILNEVKERLVRGFHPEKIILFGSQARGTADDRSDVDILVVCEVTNGRTSLTLAMDRALWGLRLARDIVVLTPEEFECDRHIPGTIARYARKEGRVLYERTGSKGEQSSEVDVTPSMLKSED